MVWLLKEIVNDEIFVGTVDVEMVVFHFYLETDYFHKNDLLKIQHVKQVVLVQINIDLAIFVYNVTINLDSMAVVD